MAHKNHQEAIVTYDNIAVVHWAKQIRPQCWAANICLPRW